MAYTSTAHGQIGLGRTGTWMQAAREYLRKVALYQRTVSELDGLSDRELADLGASRSDIRRLAHESAFGA